MRQGTLPYRILHDVDRRRLRFFTPSQVTKDAIAPQSVSRALRKLAEEGKIEAVGRGIYRRLSGRAPALSYDRAWSNPGAEFSPDKLIALTLARPTFQDVARLCQAYGVGRVRGVLAGLAADGDVSSHRANEWQHRLDNIQKGFKDASRQFAG